MSTTRLAPDRQPIHLQPPLPTLRRVAASAGFMAFALIAPLLYRSGEDRGAVLVLGATLSVFTFAAMALLARYRVTYDPARGTLTRRVLKDRVVPLVGRLELTEEPSRSFRGASLPAVAVLTPITDGRAARPLRLSAALRSPEGYTTDDLLAEVLVRAPDLGVLDPELRRRLRRVAEDDTSLPEPRPQRRLSTQRGVVLVLCAVVLVRSVQVIPAL